MMRIIADYHTSFLAVIVISGKLLLQEIDLLTPARHLPSSYDVVEIKIIQEIKGKEIRNVFGFYS